VHETAYTIRILFCIITQTKELDPQLCKRGCAPAQLRRVCVRWGPSSPPQKGCIAPSPIIGPCSLWPNGWMDQDGTLHGGGPWSTPHCARWRTSSAPQKGRAATEFAAHFYGGQTAGCIEMPLGMEVGLSPGDVVRWGPFPPPQKGGRAPNFHPTSILAKRLHG